MTARAKNVIFITSDQQRADCYGFEGRKVKTPHLDLMAAAGTRFSACITPNNVCQPARASLLTGLLPNTHGVHDNGIDLAPALGEKGLAGTLTRSGIRTGFIGKAHFTTNHTFARTGTPECRHSSPEYGPDWFGPYMGFEHVELVCEGHNFWLPQEPPGGQHYERWYYADGKGAFRNTLYNTQLPPLTNATQTWHSALPAAWHNSTWIGDQTIDYMQAHKDERFFLWASFPDPHHPFDAPDPWSRMHHPDEVDLPVERTKDLDRRPWWHRASLENTPQTTENFKDVRVNYSRMPDQDDRQLREIIANYYGMISLIDHNVGRIMTALDKLGLSEDTVVVYSTDHGDWLGDHGLILKGPINYEGLVRVGCLFTGPGVPEGKVVGDPVSSLDIPATVLDMMDVAPGMDMHSRSLTPLISGDAGRDFAYNEWTVNASRCGVALDLRLARTRTHKLTLEVNSGDGELYDLANDPHEMDNLFADAGARKVRKELEDMIRSRPADEMKPFPEPVGMA
ncbi:MAG: sulfatase-like hydrolase/transferase [Rhodospirillales bacterium]